MIDDRVKLRNLAALFWGDRWVILVITSLTVVLGVAYALTRKPLFESQALLASTRVDTSQLASISGLLGQFSGLASALGAGGGSGTSMDEAVAVLLSRDFSSRFILRHNLLPVLVPEIYVGNRSPATADISSGDDELEASLEIVGLERAVERFDQLRTVTVERRTGFVKLAIRADTPARARALARSMIAEINSELRVRTLHEAARSIELLERRMTETPYESVRAASANLLEAQLKQEVIVRSRDDFALRVLDPPSLPEQRAYPRRKRIVLVAAVIGLICAAGLSIARSAWRTYRSAGEVG